MNRREIGFYLGFTAVLVGVVLLYYYAFMREPQFGVFIIAMLLVAAGGGMLRGVSGWRGIMIGHKPWTPEDRNRKNKL